MSNEITIEIKPLDIKVARTIYYVDFYYDQSSKIDIRERMMRVIKQCIEDESLKSEVLS